ncbi:MAG: hypothetical protein AB4290_01750 [Spirulina sp.]
MSDRTIPSQNLGSVPRGTPTQIGDNEDEETKRSLKRENESAIALAKAGYNVEQNPDVIGRKQPDYKIESNIFDCYSPKTANAYNIVDAIASKINSGQAERIILNLGDSKVSLRKLRQQLIDLPISNLKEILIIKDGTITSFYPFD